MTGTWFRGVQFSNDGTLLIIHSYSPTCVIVVLNSASGTVASSRGYSANTFQNYEFTIKSMAISSGASPMAYLLSN
jgi:hypothetical protein